MKATKKTKYDFIVDLTKCDEPEWVRFEFIRAKAKAGVKLTDDDLDYIFTLGISETVDIINFCLTAFATEVKVSTTKIVMKKKPWYKRFWNWITRKNK